MQISQKNIHTRCRSRFPKFVIKCYKLTKIRWKSCCSARNGRGSLQGRPRPRDRVDVSPTRDPSEGERRVDTLRGRSGPCGSSKSVIKCYKLDQNPSEMRLPYNGNLRALRAGPAPRPRDRVAVPPTRAPRHCGLCVDTTGPDRATGSLL